MERQGNAANPARFLRPLHFAVEKHVAYRTENGALYGRPNGMPAVSVCSGLRQAHPSRLFLRASQHGQEISFGVGDRIRFGGPQCGSCNMVSYLKVPLGNLQELDALGRVNDLSGEDLMCLNGCFS